MAWTAKLMTLNNQSITTCRWMVARVITMGLTSWIMMVVMTVSWMVMMKATLTSILTMRVMSIYLQTIPLCLVCKTLWPSNWLMNTKESTYSSERRKRKSEKFVNLVRRLVLLFTVFNTLLLRCKLHLNALMTTIILFKGIESRVKDSMRFFNVSMRVKKKRLMSNSSVFLRLKKSSINLIVL